MKIFDLSGNWDLFLDENKSPEFPDFSMFSDTINLPNSTSNARKGKPNYAEEMYYLTDSYKFEGFAWYRTTVNIDSDELTGNAELFLERTRKSTVYINGEKIGSFCSLCSPHRYRFSNLKSGENSIVVLIDNTDYPTKGGHLTSPDTQTNWNGITGKIELKMLPEVYVDTVKIFTDIDKNIVKINAEIVGEKEGTALIEIGGSNKKYGSFNANFSGGKLKYTCDFAEKLPLWDEYNLNLLTASITVGDEKKDVIFGMCKISSDDLTLLVNNRETFLRGKHDGLVFPLTGFAPTDVESWLERLKICKDYGINHYRFHTCCPPEAAFTAADLLGIYMEPELPFWGTIYGEGEEKYNGVELNFLIDEGFRILKEFGNHPSFVMMSLGNELWGNKDVLNRILHDYKQVDKQKFYTSGSNNFQVFPDILEEDDFFCGVRFARDRLIRGSFAMCDAPLGFIQTNPPQSAFNYDDAIGKADSEMAQGGKVLIQYGTQVKEVEVGPTKTFVPHIPVISHETGQYCFYPDFNEESQFAGSLKPRYFNGYKAHMKETGVFEFSDKFFRASGKFAAACYKNDIEAMVRSEKLSGFQMLDLQDFPGQGVALVGILNACMKSKNAISQKAWNGFCADTVALAELEKYVFANNEKIKINFLVSTTNPNVSDGDFTYEITSAEKTINGEFAFVKSEKRITHVGEIALDLSFITVPQMLTLTVSLEKYNVQNSYDFYVYPQPKIAITDKYIAVDEKVNIARTLSEAEGLRRQNLPVVLFPEKVDGIEGTYCTDFWCYKMFRSISENANKPEPVGTLGLYIDSSHKIFKSFPTSEFSTPQWYNIVTASTSEILDNTAITPIVQTIDNTERCHKLGLLYEIELLGKPLLICNSRIWEIKDNVEVKQFAKSIYDYIINN